MPTPYSDIQSVRSGLSRISQGRAVSRIWNKRAFGAKQKSAPGAVTQRFPRLSEKRSVAESAKKSDSVPTLFHREFSNRSSPRLVVAQTVPLRSNKKWNTVL